MKQPYCPCEVPGQCNYCLQDRNGRNGCRGIFNAIVLVIIIAIMLFLIASCRQPKRIVNTPTYTVDVITVDSVKYIIANGAGTAIYRHQPGAIKE